MKPIKVTQLIEGGFGNVFLKNLVDYTDPGEVDYSFVTFGPHAGFAEDMARRGRRVYVLNAPTRRRYPLVMRTLGRVLREENPDIVHTHLFNPALAGLTLARWQKRRAVMTRHHATSHHQLSPALRRAFYLRLEGYLNRGMDHIIAPARMVRDVLVEWEHVPSEKITVIPYGQTTERFDRVTPDKIARVRAELHMNRNLALVCVSRLFPLKGHQYLFEALSGLTREGLDATLYLLGTGAYRARLEEMAAGLGLTERVRFLGWREDTLEIIAASDIVVHPSLEEALSQSTIESLMLGMPIVATDVSGAKDTLDGGKYGKLVPPADADAFREALREVIANLPAARRRAAAGREYVLDYMSAPRVAAEHAATYRRVISRSNAVAAIMK
jgi:glycosyltransferase involved in cell wall biosynthesis